MYLRFQCSRCFSKISISDVGDQYTRRIHSIPFDSVIHGIPFDSGSPSDSGQFRFDPIPGIPGIGSNSGIRGISSNFVRFRWNWIPKFRGLVGSGISWSGRNWTEFRKWEEFLGITEISSGRNSGNWMELVPLTELIPICSTSRNRMTALYWKRTSLLQCLLYLPR